MIDTHLEENHNGENKDDSMIMEEEKNTQKNFDEVENDSSEKIEEPMEEMADLLDATFPELTPRQVVTGEIVKVTDTDVVIDIGSKSEGIIQKSEFEHDWENRELEVGRKVDVFLVKRENKDGLPVLSRKKAIDIVAKQRLNKSIKEGLPVTCRVTEITKGGVKVDAGMPGFIPYSHTGVRKGNQRELKNLLGKVIEAKFLEKKGRNEVILSRRLYLEEKEKAQKEELLGRIEVGSLVKGVVKNITNFGAFVDLGGIDGLLHINDISWQYVQKAEDVLSSGQEIEAVVLKMDGEKISLGIKQKSPNPWTMVEKKYQPGQKLHGRITSLTKYGAFVELEPGVEGLIHVSEMSWVKRVNHPNEIFKVGDEVEVIILNINISSKRISLGYKQTIPNPWDDVERKFPLGCTIEGPVVGMTDYGAFIRLDEGVDGMVHVSDISWTKKIRRPDEVLKEGDKGAGCCYGC